MSVANKLYDRSHGFVGDVSASNPPMLYIDGVLPPISSSYAYEGRLQIHNNVGPCKVALLSGNLPNGYRLRVDNTTFQVVLNWPSYGVDVIGIDNAGFSSGNDGSWDLGPGWSITNTGPTDPNDPLNTNEAKYADSYGLADITNNRYVPVTAGQSITASCDMNLGGSRSDGRILLKWYDSNRNYVSPSLGDELSDNGTWQRPSVTGSAPQDGFVRISAHVNREHDNKPCWVDNFTWNYVQGSQGTNATGNIPLSLRVTDSNERVADWSGSIMVLPYSVGARYWRVWITDNCDSGSGAYMNLALIALQEYAGGPNICVGSGGVASQSTFISGYPVVNAFENPNINGKVNPNGKYWHSGDQSPYTDNIWYGKTPTNPWWAAYDFGAGQSKRIQAITFVPTNQPGRWPVSFDVQRSDDGTTWTTVKSFVGFQDGNDALWGLGTPRTATLV